jgi:uncharacterized protein involved in response to NO
MNAIPRLRPHHGPALLSYGFRPFFFLGACYAAVAILIWLPMLEGEFGLPTLFAPRDWHVHEMLYGYVPAVVTGFLLTAIPNWTGRLPLQGGPLLVLVLVWAAGRLAVTFSSWIGWVVAAAVDVSFLALVVAAAGREIVAGRNWRNLKVLLPTAILLTGNALFHAEAHVAGQADIGIRCGIAAIVIMIMLIGGRVIPSFTRNWLVRENPGRLPGPFGTFDAAALAVSVGALATWIAAPAATVTGIALIVGGTAQTVRLARWSGERTARERLVLILHVAYLFVPLGFLLLGMSAFGFIGPSAGLHAWMAGAVGTMTLAIMTRASLAHTGHTLSAGVGTHMVYAAVVFGACLRIAASLLPAAAAPMLHAAGLAWSAAFIGFALFYGPLLFRSRAR